MKLGRTSRVPWRISPVLIMVLFCSFVQGKVIRVDDNGRADFDSIQAGIDAANYGDIVSVAPGVYRENVTLRDGVILMGSGAEVTIIDANGYGDVVDARANDATIAGFTLRNSGEFDLGHMNCGVHVAGSYAPVVKNNLIIGNRIGIGLWDGACPDVRNNVIEGNSDGLYLYGLEASPTDPNIMNNTIFRNEGDGIVLRERVSPMIINNIIVGHAAGINRNYVSGTPVLTYNNLWDNDVNYLHNGSPDDTLAGPGSKSVDPRFARSGYWADMNDPDVAVIERDSENTVWIAGDYHLKSQAGRYDPDRQTWELDNVTSLCIDAGDPNSPIGLEPMPNGSAVNMGAYGGTVEASKSLSGGHGKYSGGTGEPNDPYRIATTADLIVLGETPEDYNKHFILTGDIDLDPNLPGRKVFDKAVIAPDTDAATSWFEGTPFTGIFDGNGHVISGLEIKSGGYYLGLFGQLRRAEVRDLGVVDVQVMGEGDFVGGLVGLNFDSHVTRCYTTGAVVGHDYVGGLAGRYLGHMAQCYSKTMARGIRDVGGLVGINQGCVTHCYSMGEVTGTEDVGGLVGINQGCAIYCYSVGEVNGTKGVGGLAGGGIPRGEVIECFWDTETSGQAKSAGGTGLPTIRMQDFQTYLNAGWDWTGEVENGACDVWEMPEEGGYPILVVFGEYTVPQLQGLGTAESPYLVSDVHELGAVEHYNPDACYRLTASIDLSGTRWSTAVIPSLGGTFDGNGHTISNMTVEGGGFLGLFGQLGPQAEIRDLEVTDANVTGSHDYVGSLVGRSYGGTVTRCRTIGTTSGGGYVGGLLGDNNESVIDYCSSSGTVRGSSYVGGLVGHNAGGYVVKCHSAGVIDGSSNVGGLVGRNYGEVSNCHSTGAVNGERDAGGSIGCNIGTVINSCSSGPVDGGSSVGGLVGRNGYVNGSYRVKGTIFRCYSAGVVSGDATVGGLVGWNDQGVTISSFWDTQTSGQVESADGTGETTAQMQTAKTFLDAGWDFIGETANGTDDVWWIFEGQDYPRLWWEQGDEDVTE